MNLVVSEEAQSDLDGAEAWLSENWGPLTAANVVEAVLDTIEALIEMPRSGTPRPEFGEAVRFVTSGRYVIYYEVNERELVILRVLHAAQDRDTVMRKGG